MKKKYFFWSFPFYLFCLIAEGLLVFISFKNGFSFLGLILFVLIFIILGLFQSVELNVGKYSFYYKFIFIILKKRIIEFDNIEEVYLEKNKQNKTSYASSTSKGYYINTKTIENILYIVTKEGKNITILKSIKYGKIHKIGLFFSKYFSLHLNEVTNINDISNIEDY